MTNLLDAVALLRECMERMRNESDSADPMAPFAYDADWESWALDVDAVLTGKPLPRRMRILATPRTWRVACRFDLDGRRLRGKVGGVVPHALQDARYIPGIWRAVWCEEVAHGDRPDILPPVRVQGTSPQNPLLLFISSLKPYRAKSIINPARTVLEYVRAVRAPRARTINDAQDARRAHLLGIGAPPPASAYSGACSVNVEELRKVLT
jgi:hypothetical protein